MYRRFLEFFMKPRELMNAYDFLIRKKSVNMIEIAQTYAFLEQMLFIRANAQLGIKITLANYAV